ncbi:hypothetical protein FRB99_007829 [Tulasnella sp. 403]|nr:hypothetical protein FRB99_007829 [Tulasnella sp. 403]
MIPKCEKRGTKIDFFYRTRLCGRCYNKWFVTDREIKAVVSGAGEVIEVTTTGHRLVFGFDRLPKRRNYRPLVEACYAEWCELPENDKAALGGFLDKWVRDKVMKLKTGKAIQHWVTKSIDSPWTGEENRRKARVAEVWIRLKSAGWKTCDIPSRNPKFLALAGKGPPLTPEVWQDLLPKLEPIVKARQQQQLKNNNRWRERMRQRQRASRLRTLYSRLIQEYTPDWIHRRAVAPTEDDFFDMLAVERIFTVGDEQVPQRMWDDAEEEGRLLFLSTQEEKLAHLLAVLKVDREPPPEDQPARRVKIQETTTLLSRLTSGFWCQTCQSATWFPFALSYHTEHSLVSLVDSPLSPPGKPFLVTALLASAGLDEATFDVNAEDTKIPRFLCSRCDQRVAQPKTFPDLLRHYHSAQVWYERVTMVVNSNPKKAYQKRRKESFEPPLIVNCHDWSTDEPLVRECSLEQLQELEQQRLAFEGECRKDPDDDGLGEGGEAFAKDWMNRRLLRTCKLCPVGYSPEHTSSARIKVHIQSCHNKEPDLEMDTNLHSKHFPRLIQPAIMS